MSASFTDAVVPLLESVGEPVFDSNVTGAQKVPWVVFSLGVPDASERGMASLVHARSVYLMVKYVAGTAEYSRQMAELGDDALEGARLDVDGWRLGPLKGLNFRAPSPDYELTTTEGVQPITTVCEYLATTVRSR